MSFWFTQKSFQTDEFETEDRDKEIYTFGTVTIDVNNKKMVPSQKRKHYGTLPPPKKKPTNGQQRQQQATTQKHDM